MGKVRYNKQNNNRYSIPQFHHQINKHFDDASAKTHNYQHQSSQQQYRQP